MIVTVIEMLESRLEELKKQEQTEEVEALRAWDGNPSDVVALEVQYRMKEVERTLRLIGCIDEEGEFCYNAQGQLCHYETGEVVSVE